MLEIGDLAKGREEKVSGCFVGSYDVDVLCVRELSNAERMCGLYILKSASTRRGCHDRIPQHLGEGKITTKVGRAANSLPTLYLRICWVFCRMKNLSQLSYQGVTGCYGKRMKSSYDGRQWIRRRCHNGCCWLLVKGRPLDEENEGRESIAF